MNQFEYLIPFVGIIYALCATDLLISTHRLIVERGNVKLHPVPIIWAVISFLLIINGWWGFLQINENIQLENAGQLFLLSLLPLMVFLISALSLPHKVEQGLDLWQYFQANKTPFYLFHALYLVLIPAVLSGFADDLNVTQIVRNLVMSVILFALVWLKHWLWHLSVGLVFMGSLLLSIFSQTISL